MDFVNRSERTGTATQADTPITTHAVPLRATERAHRNRLVNGLTMIQRFRYQPVDLIDHIVFWVHDALFRVTGLGFSRASHTSS